MQLVFVFIALFALAFAEWQPKDYDYLIKESAFQEDMLKLHFKLYQGYVKNSNELSKKIYNSLQNGNNIEYSELKRRFAWEYDGMRLHELYFENLGANGQIDPNSSIYLALKKQFGSYENWKKDFIATGNIRGIGWVILYYDTNTQMFTNAWIAEHNSGHLVNEKPLLIMDVFEHAYMLQFGLNKAHYIDTFFSSIKWQEVQNRYDQLQSK